MYIYLDESYNLKDRTKLQFLSISGFKTTNIKPIWKHWKVCRQKYLGKSRIHGTDKYFEDLREKSLRLLNRPEVSLMTIFQIIQEIPSDYFVKGKLNFDKIYLELIKIIFGKLDLQEYKKVTIIVDNRKYKFGALGKKKIQNDLLFYLQSYYQDIIFNFKMQPSATDILLEVTDFVSNSFYKQYLGQQINGLEKMKNKTIQIKNPLTKLRDL